MGSSSIFNINTYWPVAIIETNLPDPDDLIIVISRDYVEKCNPILKLNVFAKFKLQQA